MVLGDLTEKIVAWGATRCLINKDFRQAQMCKIMEEVGETSAALLKGKDKELIDGIGDILVTVILFAAQNGLTVEQCLEAAWNEIKNRKGELKDGAFIKE